MQRPDLTRATLTILFILLLILTSLWVLRPFLAAATWAAMLVVATWPLMTSLQERLGKRRTLAVLVMLLALLLVMATPLWLISQAVLDHASEVAAFGRKLAASGIPAPPAWLEGIPLAGPKLVAIWRDWAAAGPDGLLTKIQPHAAQAAQWVLAQLGSLGGLLIHLALVIILSGVMYFQGEFAVRTLKDFSRRLAGELGEGIVVLSGQAIRGVAMGVGVTALVQTLLGGLGLAIAGVPFASLLTMLMLVLCIAQLGPGLVLFPAVGWLYWTGDIGWAVALLVWSVLVVALDNFLRPYLIKKGADLPLLLIFAGVIGGLLGFGLIGIFIGPLVLAVTYKLLGAWIDESLAVKDR